MSSLPPSLPIAPPPPDVYAPAAATGIEVTAGFLPLAFILFLCPPTVEINGLPQQVKWGTHFFPTPPGGFQVTVYFRYLWMSRCGANSVNAWVQPGLITRVSYYAPFLMTMAGTIRLV